MNPDDHPGFGPHTFGRGDFAPMYLGDHHGGGEWHWLLPLLFLLVLTAMFAWMVLQSRRTPSAAVPGGTAGVDPALEELASATHAARSAATSSSRPRPICAASRPRRDRPSHRLHLPQPPSSPRSGAGPNVRARRRTSFAAPRTMLVPARRGGRAVECGGLENRWACKRLLGSNPSPAALGHGGGAPA